MEPRAAEITRPSAEWAEVRLADRGCHGWTSECRWIEPLIDVMEASVGILSWNPESVASESRGRGSCTRNGSRLSILQCKNPVGCPSPKQGVYSAARVMQEAFSFPNGQLIGSAKVENFIHVEVAPAVVRVDAEARQERRSIGGK